MSSRLHQLLVDQVATSRQTRTMDRATSIFATAADGLALEIDILGRVAAGGTPSAMIWAARAQSLTLPERYARTEPFADAAADMDASGWPVITRRTGGGITPQGPGVVNLALAFTVPPKDARSVAATYAAICDPLVTILADFGVTARAGSVQNSFCDGDFNLEVDGRKLVGTAQRWRGNAVLCHALILIDLDLGAAVRAAQDLADRLQLDDTYLPDVHTRLVDCVQIDASPGEMFSKALAQHLATNGFQITRGGDS